MPVSSKPRRKHRPVPARNPNLSRQRDGWLAEGQVYSALLALEAEDCHPTHLAWLVSHGMLVYRVAAGAADRGMQDKAMELLAVCAGIRDRAGATLLASDDAPLDVTAKEEIKIRAVTWETLPWLRAQPNQAVFLAVSAALDSLESEAVAIPVSAGKDARMRAG